MRNKSLLINRCELVTACARVVALLLYRRCHRSSFFLLFVGNYAATACVLLCAICCVRRGYCPHLGLVRDYGLLGRYSFSRSQRGLLSGHFRRLWSRLWSIADSPALSFHCCMVDISHKVFYYFLPPLLYTGWNDVTESMVTIRSPSCGYNFV